MKLILAALLSTTTMQAEMQPLEVLHQFETLYDGMKPAEEKTGKAFVWFSGLPHFLLNAVMHLQQEGDVEKKVDALLAKAPIGLPLSFWIHDHNRAEGLENALQARGFEPVISCALMARSPAPVTKTAFEVRPMTKETREDFHQVMAVCNGFDDSLSDAFAQFLDPLAVENYLVYADGQPVGTGTLFVDGNVGGIFNDSTLPGFYEQGVGQSMMQFLIGRAHELGVKRLIVQSAPGDLETYASLGFERALEIEIYARWRTSPL